MKLTKSSLTAIAFVALFASCGNSGSNETQNKEKTAPLVTVVSVGAEDVDITNTFTSNIEAFAVNNIVSQTAGRIKNIRVDVGSKVRKGQLLAEMDEVNLLKTRLQYVNDSIELDRLNELVKVGGVSQANYDLAKLSLELTKKTYENLLENTRLTSPINGIVTARNYDAGDMYSMALPIFVVQQITPVKLLINVPESRFSDVKNDMEFDIVTESYPNETFKGKVNIIYPSVSATTHTFPVEITVPNADQRLRPGMFARVTANFGTNHHIVIPDVAVVKQVGSGEHFVYVLKGDNTVKYTLVELGRRLGDRYEVVSGLNEGDKIVTEGQARLKDGIEVTVK